jgi:hypothetical protein
MENWGWPFTFTFTANVQQYEHLSDVSTTLLPKEFPLVGNTEVDLPADFLHANIIVHSYNGRVATIDVSRSDQTEVTPIPQVPNGSALQYINNYHTATNIIYTFGPQVGRDSI